MLLTPQVYARPSVLGFRLSMLRDAQMSIDSIAQSNTATASLVETGGCHASRAKTKACF